jgi:Tol biopolymer transport system component
VGDTTSKMLMNAGAIGVSPEISPDGKWMAYSSNESGAAEAYITHFPDVGARWPISAGGGNAPMWAPGGNAVYYVNGSRMIKAALNMTNGVTVLRRDTLFTVPGALSSPLRQYDISRDGKHFLFAAPVDSSNSVVAVLNWRKELKARIARSSPD